MTVLWVSACSPPATVKYSGSGSSGKSGKTDAGSSTDGSTDGPGSSINESCQVEDGDQACQDGLFCAALDGGPAVCLADHSREDGQECTADVQCVSYRCSQKTERCAASPGADCNLADGCGPGGNSTDIYVCIEGTCQPSTGENGESCTGGYDCVSGVCKDNVCVSGEIGNDCSAPDHCQSDICVAGTCSDGATGDGCENPVDCVSGACKEGQCVAGNIGDACTLPAHCQSEVCLEGVCAGGQSNGQPGDDCTQPTDCQSSFCVAGTCSDGATGADCETPADCQSESCVDEMCEEGGLFPGTVCMIDEQCNGALCIDNHCHSGQIGSTCVDSNDCDGALICNRQCHEDICASTCTNGLEGAPCINRQACKNDMRCSDQNPWPIPGVPGMELDTCLGEEVCEFHASDCSDSEDMCLRTADGSFCGRPGNGEPLSDCVDDRDCASGVCSDHGSGTLKCSYPGGWGAACMIAHVPDHDPIIVGCNVEQAGPKFQCDTTLPTPIDEEDQEGIEGGYCGGVSGHFCYTKHPSTNMKFDYEGGCAVGGLDACAPSANKPKYCEHNPNLSCNNDKFCACDGVVLAPGELCDLGLVPGRRCLEDYYCP